VGFLRSHFGYSDHCSCLRIFALGALLVLAPSRFGLICDSSCDLVDLPCRNRTDLLSGGLFDALKGGAACRDIVWNVVVEAKLQLVAVQLPGTRTVGNGKHEALAVVPERTHDLFNFSFGAGPAPRKRVALLLIDFPRKSPVSAVGQRRLACCSIVGIRTYPGRRARHRHPGPDDIRRVRSDRVDGKDGKERSGNRK
jgi:hypothetical protein